MKNELYYSEASEMAELDEIAVRSGLEIRQMMELAGWHIIKIMNIANIQPPSKVAVVVGTGNKGGDGLSAARHLLNYGYNVDIYLLSNEISSDSQHHLSLLNGMGASVYLFDHQELNRYDVIIDSLIGYRLNGAPSKTFASAVEKINDSTSLVVSYDLPTGVDATSGKTPGDVVVADYTLMLALPKQALNYPKTRDIMGTVFIADIGIPAYLYDHISLNSRPNFNSSGLLQI